tara:strand:+ start:56 stop:463 length:408 start_codon:yes stop_codon:yes gene_type:complete
MPTYILPITNSTSTSTIEATKNKYILIQKGKPYINLGTAEQFLLPFKSPLYKQNGHKQLGIKLFLYDRAWGFKYFTDKIDLSKEITEEGIEEFLLQSVSLYLFKEIGKFPLEEETSPPIDKTLNEIGLTINDFNF